MRKAFSRSRVVMGTRQPKSLRKMLIRSKFSMSPPPPRLITDKPGLFSCFKCIYHENQFIIPCSEFRFGKFKWIYTRRFDCDSKNVIYILKCNGCRQFYMGETMDFKQRTTQHKSDYAHPHNSNCKKLMNHLRGCSKIEPYFTIFPIYFVDDPAKRLFIEKRMILYFQPSLNSDSTY